MPGNVGIWDVGIDEYWKCNIRDAPATGSVGPQRAAGKGYFVGELIWEMGTRQYREGVADPRREKEEEAPHRLGAEASGQKTGGVGG